MDARLVAWKSTSLNLAGRVVLMKSTLDSLPAYWFNIFSIPQGVCQKLESIRRSFLWGEYKDKGEKIRKIHLLG